MNGIKSQLLGALGGIPLTQKKVKNPVMRPNLINNFLNSKEVQVIDEETEQKLMSWTPTPLLPEYEEYYRSLTDEDKPENDYSKLTDAYGVCELYADSKRLRVTPDYLKWMKTTDTGFVLNIYGVNTNLFSSFGEDIWDLSNFKGRFDPCDLPAPELATPTDVTYTEIGTKIYNDRVYLEECRDAVAVLAMDIPHVYYSKQNLKGGIYTWDLIKEKYQIGGMDLDEVNERIYRIATLGFQQPLVMRINEGCLTPIDDETAVDMFLATYMNIPTIPVLLFMSNDPAVVNPYAEEMFELVQNNFWKNPSAADMASRVFMPYFFFEYIDSYKNEPYLECENKRYRKEQYPLKVDPNDDTIVVFDRALDTKVDVAPIPGPKTAEEEEAETQARFDEMQAALDKKLAKKYEKMLEEIRNTEI